MPVFILLAIRLYEPDYLTVLPLGLPTQEEFNEHPDIFGIYGAIIVDISSRGMEPSGYVATTKVVFDDECGIGYGEGFVTIHIARSYRSEDTRIAYSDYGQMELGSKHIGPLVGLVQLIIDGYHTIVTIGDVAKLHIIVIIAIVWGQIVDYKGSEIVARESVHILQCNAKGKTLFYKR